MKKEKREKREREREKGTRRDKRDSRGGRITLGRFMREASGQRIAVWLVMSLRLPVHVLTREGRIVFIGFIGLAVVGFAVFGRIGRVDGGKLVIGRKEIVKGSGRSFCGWEKLKIHGINIILSEYLLYFLLVGVWFIFKFTIPFIRASTPRSEHF